MSIAANKTLLSSRVGDCDKVTRSLPRPEFVDVQRIAFFTHGHKLWSCSFANFSWNLSLRPFCSIAGESLAQPFFFFFPSLLYSFSCRLQHFSWDDRMMTKSVTEVEESRMLNREQPVLF
ncbi:hypothetical protein GYMLUDRAFT_778169 [Collybiopsis luxurians FD-317 M1]|uniref:Unplaced genomic scaffold GYMLUscaffold_47, whole genome shotgun sequence n=1 Tax=Collybiopsis luxurians FD-317 M1 TaxID=944289 RepID=A0A0D0CNG9_9AGAR|nr:hypothetical protein GYMLUDRAFT_778169 [Collybiopsis luxurians FD-317 M1]